MSQSSPNQRNTRFDLRNAAISLGASKGIHAASIRTIAKQAGVTEGAVYKHFASKDDLIKEAYTTIVDEMAKDKEALINSDLPFEQAVHEWINLTYEYFDGNRDAFTYVLLMPHRMADTLGEIYTKQGMLFKQFFQRAGESKQICQMDPALALAIFTGCVLNIPRLITEGSLPAPASQYTDQITDSVLRIFATS